MSDPIVIVGAPNTGFGLTLPGIDGRLAGITKSMKIRKSKPRWQKPQMKVVPLCCECTAYVEEAA